MTWNAVTSIGCAVSSDTKPRRAALALAVSVVLISVFHYLTSFRSVELHEVFQRLYYVPIVIAAVLYGMKGGLAAAGLSTALYLPHVVLKWHGWPTFQVEQYAEILVFTLVAIVTGFLADRLRAQRDQCRRTAVELDGTCRRLEASIEERLRADRLVTIGRLASGIAHEIRTPLGGLMGSLEILGSDIPRGDSRAQFFAIARNQIDRLNRVVADFLDFADPPAPATQAADIGTIVHAAVRLAGPILALHGGTIDADMATGTPQVEVDVDQVERALLNLLIDEAAVNRHTRIVVTADQPDRLARIIVSAPVAPTGLTRNLADIFELFPGSDPGAGLTLATTRRLIENQGGTIRAEHVSGSLRYVIELPLADRHGRARAPGEDGRLEPLRSD